MYTTETTLAALEKYDIDPATLSEWERELNLTIPMDSSGQKRYSPHHINLFKNIRKHLALGRSLSQIRDMVTLPPADQGRPTPKQNAYVSQPVTSKVMTNPVVSIPVASIPETNGRHVAPQASVTRDVTPSETTLPTNLLSEATAPAAPQHNALLTLVERLMAEKDQLNKKLMETEKLNSHLYNANALFHRKVKEHANQVEQLQGQLVTAQEKHDNSDQMRHLDEKSRLHKQLLDMEKHLLHANQQIVQKEQHIQQMNQRAGSLEQRINEVHKPIPAETFIGQWQETAQLSEVVYDSFGINFESDRKRNLNIPEAPTRRYGNAAVLITQYDYDANPMWKRHETLFISYINDNQLTGELVTEFLLDGVPVGKAVYAVNCLRHTV